MKGRVGALSSLGLVDVESSPSIPAFFFVRRHLDASGGVGGRLPEERFEAGSDRDGSYFGLTVDGQISHYDRGIDIHELADEADTRAEL